MTKYPFPAKLIDQIHADMDWLTRKEVKAAVDAMLEAIVEGLATGHRVRLERFGTFEPEYLPARHYWHTKKLRLEHAPETVAIRFFQSKRWVDHPGFEHVSLFEKRLREKRWRRTQAYLAKKKPRR